MNFVFDIQLFASKKGVGSTKNGRDSESKRLGAKLSDGQFCHADQSSIVKEEQKFIQVPILVEVKMILYSL